MTVSEISMTISSPTGPTLPGRGFYQLEEESLFVQIGQFNDRHRFFSYLEADHTRLDIDKTGHLLFIELEKSRRHWTIDSNLLVPTSPKAADLCFIPFRESIVDPKISTNASKDIIKLDFSSPKLPADYLLAENIIATINENGSLAAIWVISIIDDLAGQEIAAFRKQTRNAEAYFS